MIKLRHQQPSLWHRGLAEDIEGLWEPWMRLVDELLEDEQLLDTVYEAQGERHPQSRIRGRMQTPAEVAGLAQWLETMVERVRQVVKQTKIRIFAGDTKSPGKIVSVFEPHTEIIRKGKASKPKEFGKLVKIQEAENQIVTHFAVFAERPADSTLLLSSIEVHQQRLGRMPRRAAADAGFYSRENEKAGQAPGGAVNLRGSMIEINPYKDDLFRKVIEQRKLNKSDKKLYYWLNILANSIYGFFVELIPELQNNNVPLEVFSGEKKFPDSPDVIEKAGPWFFPPLASMITSAGRLLLAMTEECVNRKKGTYLFCDTDPLAIVSSKNGGLLNIAGSDGRRILPWAEGQRIANKFWWMQITLIPTPQNHNGSYMATALPRNATLYTKKRANRALQ